MKKRGQLLGQPLIMIFAMIVGALILVWGLYEGYKVIGVSKDVQVIDYITNLKRDVQRYYYFEPGSSSVFKISVPSDFTYVCFANRDGTPSKKAGWVYPANYNNDFVVGRKSDNVFVYSKDKVLAYYVPYLKTPSLDVSCFKNGYKIKLMSKGTYVEVTDG
jgi:hypothetical protein